MAKPSSTVVRSYEVHVEGRLGRALLGALGWSSRLQPEQTVIRVRAGVGDLDRLLEACSAYGLVVERVTRLSQSRS